MKKACLILVLAITFAGSVRSQNVCRNSSPESPFVSNGANETVTGERVTRRRISGQITDINGLPLSIAIVDVFRISSVNREENEWKIVYGLFPDKSFSVDQQGRFCLLALPDGEYVLRVGTNQAGFNQTHIRVTKNRRGSKKPIRVTLSVGT